VKLEEKNPKPSSILILLYPENDILKTVLIQRHSYNGVHSGQISFPGGQREESDTDKIETALREASEEVGINPDKVKILGMLTNLYIAPSNYCVTPVVGFTDKLPEFVLQASEVKGIIQTPLFDFVKKETKKSKIMKLANGMVIDTPYYDIQGNVVWGATAMIISELETVILEIASKSKKS